MSGIAQRYGHDRSIGQNIIKKQKKTQTLWKSEENNIELQHVQNNSRVNVKQMA